MKWYIHAGGQQQGPCELEDVKELVIQGKINARAFVWKPGMAEWKKITEVPELAEVLATTPNSAGTGSITNDLRPQSLPKLKQHDDLSVFIEMPKVAHEKTKEISKQAAGQLRKEVKKAEVIVTRTQAVHDSRHILPRVAWSALFLGIAAGAVMAFVLNTKRELAPIAGVSNEDYLRMRSAVISQPTQGIKVEVAPSLEDPVHPRIYVASNQPDGTRFSVLIKGVAGTLVKPLAQPVSFQVPPQKGYHSATARLELPRGEYQVEVTLLGEAQILASGTFFLGGVKDAEYEAAIKSNQTEHKQKSDVEVRNLNEAITVLEGFQELLVEFNTDIGPGKHPTEQRVHDIQKRWDELEKSLPGRSSIWKSDVSESEFYYTHVVHLARETWQEFRAAERLYVDFASKTKLSDSEAKTLNDAIQVEVNKGRNIWVSLKAEMDKTH